MIDKNIKRFNRTMERYNMQFIPRRDYDGNIYKYELYINNEDALLPDGYDSRPIQPEDLNIHPEYTK